MDPKHVIQALAAMYIEEHGGRVTFSKGIIVESYRKSFKLTVTIIHDDFTRLDKIIVFLED